MPLDAIEQAQRIIATDVEPGSRNEAATLEVALAVLNRRDVVAAINRLHAGATHTAQSRYQA